MVINMASSAGDALCRIALVSMAFFTGHRDVLAKEREARERVIELNALLPIVRIVAALALIAQLAFMRIVFAMASHARRRRLDDIGRLLVAPLALGGFVRANQFEARHRIMVEARYLPVAAVVTFCAIGPVTALVTIVFCMAAVAGSRRLLDAIPHPMTLRACCGAVFSKQGEARILVVIETC
jgi:hypothetical protein